MLKRLLAYLTVVVAVIAAGVYYYESTSSNVDARAISYNQPTRIKCIVGGPDPYWKMVIAGAKDGAIEFGAEVDVLVPKSLDSSKSEQSSALLTMSETLYDGVMLCPLDPQSQTKSISMAATKMFVVTFDTEAPAAIAHYHVGANNQMAGQQAAELVRQVIPNGGEVALFVGDISRSTASIRRQVLINTLAGREAFKPVSEDLEERISAGNYTIVGTYLDNRSLAQAERNATKALEEHPEVKCLVGLYSKNGMACVNAVEMAGKSSTVKVVAFDQLEPTLNGIQSGKIVGTVVQDPYSFGFESVRLLCDLHKRGDEKAPARFSGKISLATHIVDAESLDDYEAQLMDQIGQESTEDPKD